MQHAIYSPKDSVSAKFQKAALAMRRGSGATHERMKSTFNNLQRIAKRWGRDFSPDTLTEKQWLSYVQIRITEGATARVVQLECGHIRRALRSVGRGNFAETCTNKALGVPSGTRIGTGTAITPEVYDAALAKAAPNVHAGLRLMSSIGLRLKELVRCTADLVEWQTALYRQQPLLVRTGTKGARARSVPLSPANAAVAAVAIEDAIDCVKKAQQLHPGDSKYDHLFPAVSLLGARKSLQRALKKLDIEKIDSAHAIRRDYCVREYLYMTSALGISHKEALRRIVLQMGHSDRRGRWCWNCYISPTLGGVRAST